MALALIGYVKVVLMYGHGIRAAYGVNRSSYIVPRIGAYRVAKAHICKVGQHLLGLHVYYVKVGGFRRPLKQRKLSSIGRKLRALYGFEAIVHEFLRCAVIISYVQSFAGIVARSVLFLYTFCIKCAASRAFRYLCQIPPIGYEHLCALHIAIRAAQNILGVSGFVYKRIVILGQLMLIRLYYGPLLLDGGDVFIDYVFNKHLGCYV